MSKKHLVLLLLSGLILSSCSDGFRGYFKKSANNKWFDTKGFNGAKRKPLYNEKYVSLAKRNVMDDNLDEDDSLENISFDDDNGVDPATRNRLIYTKMVKADKIKSDDSAYVRRSNLFGRQKHQEPEGYPSLAEVSDRTKADNYDREKLARELAQIKSMLSEAKRDLARYKCPMNVNNQELINTPSNQLETKKPFAIENYVSDNNITKNIEPRHHEEINSVTETTSNKEQISEDELKEEVSASRAYIKPSAI